MQILQHLLMGIIRLYRWLVSPVLTSLFNPNGLCRFNPSCSEYALQAIQLHGPFRGSWLALKRLLRCHPWGACGDDPVPPKQHGKSCGCEHPDHSTKADSTRPDALPVTGSGIHFVHRPTSF